MEIEAREPQVEASHGPTLVQRIKEFLNFRRLPDELALHLWQSDVAPIELPDQVDQLLHVRQTSFIVRAIMARARRAWSTSQRVSRRVL
jgi:hypothetical protein